MRKEKYLKKITAVLLCVMLVFSLAACNNGGGSGASGTSANAASGGKNTTDASGKADDPGKSGEPGTNDRTSGKIAELEQKYKNLTQDDLKWEYNTASKTVVISGKGPMKDYTENAPEWDVYRETAEKIVIGDEVTSVGFGAFLSFSAVTEVKLGEAVEFVGDYAFDNCISLRTMNFPSNLKYIGESAFNNILLHSDNGFKFPEGMLYIGKYAFHSSFKEGTVTIPASLLVIGKYAFANMFVSGFAVDENNPNYASVDGVLYDKGITTLINYPAGKQDKLFTIPDTVTTICEEAIEVNNTLEKIVIPASVSSIEEGSIFWNYALTVIDVDANNNSYKSVDGVLFTKDGKKLICYPIASDRTEYTVPQGTERICKYAMSSATNLKEIHTNEGLLEIGDTGLYFCDNLNKLGLPKSLTSIEAKALALCNSLTEVRYAGTNSDWKNIKIGEQNEILTSENVRIYCAE